MAENMTVTAEVWPVAADDAGISLISGRDAWRYGPVKADSDVHYEIELLLFQHGIDPGDAVFLKLGAGAPRTGTLHMTSGRPDGPTYVLTYMAVVDVSGYVLETWPGAAPITAALPEAVGKAPPHGAAEVPVPRWVDVPLHGLRHLAFLRDHDAEVGAALDADWRRHLAPLEPALFTMFSERLREAS